MKRTSSWTTWNSSTSAVPRARKKSTRRWTSSSGALAPEVIPTTRTPSSHSSWICASLSMRYDAAPPPAPPLVFPRWLGGGARPPRGGGGVQEEPVILGWVPGADDEHEVA